MVESGEFTVSVVMWNISNPTLFIKSLIEYKTLQTTEFSNVHEIKLINFSSCFVAHSDRSSVYIPGSADGESWKHHSGQQSFVWAGAWKF